MRVAGRFPPLFQEQCHGWNAQQHDGCEPDARNYTCESCGEPKVFGAEELLLMNAWKGERGPGVKGTATADV